MSLASLDPLVFSSAWVAAAAAALCLAAGSALGGGVGPVVPALAFCGTLFVYNVDRLRDLPRDRTTSPARSAFVARWRRPLLALTALSGVASACLAFLSGPAIVVLLAPVLGAGLYHRRLKRFGWWKPLYVTAAWTGVTVGLPALALAAGGSGAAPRPAAVAWVAALVGATLAANVIASNLRDGEALTARLSPRAPLRIARGFAAAGLLAALVAPPAQRSLLWVPLATLAALAGFRSEERYGLVVVDGALLAGALLAWALSPVMPGPSV
jgi:4-hydroxybenzoate polyprenyltransferase